jgi:hypothetical protein
VGSLHAFVVSELQRLQRCPEPGAVFEQLRNLICDQVGVQPGQVTSEARFVKDLRMD